jgi:peroxiredoxin Q/BCP
MKIVLLFIAALFFAPAAYSQGDKKPAESDKSLSVGMKAPDFTLEDAHGKKYSLSSFRGKNPVVVYFYPKANTAGCTKQACGIRDDWSKFEKNNIKVLGISTDPKKDISNFISENNLNFPLLSDSAKEVSRHYGVLNENGYANRVTFIIDKKGEIRNIINVKDIDNHSKEVMSLALKLK